MDPITDASTGRKNVGRTASKSAASAWPPPAAMMMTAPVMNQVRSDTHRSLTGRVYVHPMRFDEYAKTSITTALERTPSEVAQDVYVVSLFVRDEADDPRYPTVAVGFNTEAQVASTLARASDADEARWNFAFWIQDELGLLGDEDDDPEGTRLREQWIRQADLWYSDDEEDDDPGVATTKGAQITSRFAALLVAVAQQLHAEGTIGRVFGRPIPVLIHELEYDDAVAEQNRRANPDGLADDFARWIEKT